MLASVDIIFVFVSPPSTRYLFNWVANIKPSSHNPAVHSCMHSSCRAICRFCHRSRVGSKDFGALGELGNFCASKHKFTYSGTKHSSVTKIFLPYMASRLTNKLIDFLQHLRGVALLLLWFCFFFSLKILSSLGVCTTSLICHLPNAVYILENVCCQI